MRNFILAFTSLFLCSFVADAKIHSALNINACIRDASNIIIVKENDQPHGRVTVLESLLGGIKVGDSLYISQLARFKPEKSPQIFCTNILGDLTTCLDPTIPKVVTGRRVFLFLENKHSLLNHKKLHAMAAVWIEQGVVYGLYDGTNAWEGPLAPFGSEENLRNRITDIRREKGSERGRNRYSSRQYLFRPLLGFIIR